MALNDTTTWTGASNSTWSTAGNWTNGVPDTDGTAIIDGSVSITGGSGISNTEVDRVFVASTYTGSIGSSGTPLELDVAELSVDNSSSGSTHYLHCTGSNNTTPTVLVDGAKTGNALYLSGDINLLIVEPTFVGTMYLGNSASKQATPKDVVMLTSSGTVDATTAGNVAWVSSATVHLLSGTLKLGENIGASSTLNMSGGTLTVSDWTKVSSDVLNLSGGTVNWNAGSTGVDTPTATTITTLNVMGGSFTTAANVKAQVGFTTINQYGGTVNLQSSFANIEILTAYNGYAGTYSPPKQSVITTSPK